MTDTIPHSEESERGLIGSLLLDNQKVMYLCSENNITTDSFYLPQHKYVFSAIENMLNEDKRVDMITVGEYLKEKGQLDSVGGYLFLEELIDDTPTAAHAEHYIGTVRDRHIRRQIIATVKEAVTSCRSDLDEPAERIVAVHSENITNIVTHKEDQTASEAMSDNRIVLDNAYRGIVSGVPLPWEKFSNHTGGLQRACVTPFVGRDGKGKSGALAQCLDFWAGKGIPTLAFSLEDVKRRTLLRMGGCRMWYSARCAEMGTVRFNGRFDKMTAEDKRNVEGKIGKYEEFIADKPFWIFDDPVTVEDVCSKVRHYVRTKRVQVVTIDGFKDIQHSKGESQTARESHIAKTLQSLAKSEGVAILVVSHINKIDDGMPISKIHITGSGEQSKGARQVIIFQDAGIEGIDGETTFGLAMSKSNFGGSGIATLQRDEDVLHYSEM